MNLIFNKIDEYVRKERIPEEISYGSIAFIDTGVLYKVIITNVFIYEYDRLETLELIFLKLIKLGIKDPILISYLLGNISYDIITELASSLEKKGLITIKHATIADIKESWEELANMKIIPRPLIDELKIHDDLLLLYDLTDDGEYSVQKEIRKIPFLARFVELLVDPEIKAVIDYRYSLTSMETEIREDNKVNEELPNFIEILRDNTLRLEWLVPEDIGQPTDQSKMIFLSKENYYRTVIFSSNGQISNVRGVPLLSRKLKGTKISKFSPFRDKWREAVKRRIFIYIKDKARRHINQLLDSFEELSKSNEGVVLLVANIFGKVFKLSLADINEVIGSEKHIIVETAIDNRGYPIQIYFDDAKIRFIINVQFVPKNNELAFQSILEFIKHKIRSMKSDFADDTFWNELKVVMKKLSTLWSEYINDVIGIWNRALIYIPNHLWKQKEYYLVYKLRMRNDLFL